MGYLSSNINDYSGEQDAFRKSLRGNRNAFNAGQAGQETDYLSKYKSFIDSQENLPALYERLGRETGFDKAKQGFEQAQSTMSQIPKTYQDATRGTETTANQEKRLIGAKQAEYAPVFQGAQQAYQGAQETADRALTANMLERDRTEKPLALEGNLLQNRLAREATGYSEDLQAEKSMLDQKLQSGIQLTMAENQRLKDLELAERAYKQAIEVANIGASANKYSADMSYKGKLAEANPLYTFWN